MADEITVRAGRLYWRNRKCLEANKFSIKFAYNRKPIPGPAGVVAWTEGMATATLTFEEFIPVGGSTTTHDIEMVITQKEVDAAVRIGGRWYRQRWAVTENEMSSDSETGVCTGRYTLQGKAEKLAGAEGRE